MRTAPAGIDRTMNLNLDRWHSVLCLLCLYLCFRGLSVVSWILRLGALCDFLWCAFCFYLQVSEWNSCPAGWRRQWEHVLWVPTAAAQTLHWVYQDSARGQQGNVTSMHVSLKTLKLFLETVRAFKDDEMNELSEFSMPLICFLFGIQSWRTPLE